MRSWWRTLTRRGSATSRSTGAATTTYFRGDKTFVTLDTSAVPEGSRLYFTNARALGILLAGFDNTLTGQVSAADSMLQGFGRLQNQINSLNSGGSNYLVKNGADTISGTVSLTNVLTASGAGDIIVPSSPAGVTSAINGSYVNTNYLAKTGGSVNGSVGVGAATAPSEALMVTGNSQTVGQAYSSQYLISSGATVDFNNGNLQILQSVGGSAITLNNMKDGGTYTLAVQGTIAGTASFIGSNPKLEIVLHLKAPITA